MNEWMDGPQLYSTFCYTVFMCSLSVSSDSDTRKDRECVLLFTDTASALSSSWTVAGMW